MIIQQYNLKPCYDIALTILFYKLSCCEKYFRISKSENYNTFFSVCLGGGGGWQIPETTLHPDRPAPRK